MNGIPLNQVLRTRDEILVAITMKNKTLPKLIELLLTPLVCCLLVASAQAATPKKLLVVTVTKGFRHSSIPTAEKILADLAKTSGAFTVDYARNDQEIADKMTPAALKQYDGAIFANTTGDLPLPDKQAFIDWIKSGKAFIGMHSASDTFHGFPPYIEMLGGEFQTHHAQVKVDCRNHDPKHPSTRHLGAAFTVFDEIYLQKNFHRDQVHVLLALDAHPNEKTPGFYPISWCKEFGSGRVFYTSLGHREDMWDADTPEKFKRENSKDISEAYQKHILGGIQWALGLEQGDAKPQSK
jgi:type 1 glutamine amidotransferase